MSNGFLGGSTLESPVTQPPAVEAPAVVIETAEPVAETAEIETQEADFLQAEAVPEPTPAASADGSAAAAAATAVVKDQIVLEVEKILEDGLGDYFKDWSGTTQQRFLQTGQAIGVEIAEMVRRLQVRSRRVLELIRHWLLMIPGVNKFFLEQEAKIKTDRILELEQTYREEAQGLPAAA